MRRIAFTTATALVLLSGAYVGTAAAAPAPPGIDRHLQGGVFCGPGLVLDGSAEAGSTVSVFDAGTNEKLGSAVASDISTWRMDVTSHAGVNTVYAVASDATGTSEPSATISYTVDEPPFITDLRTNVVSFSPRNHDGFMDDAVASVLVRSPGDLVFRFAFGPQESGNSAEMRVERGRTYSAAWDGRDPSGDPLPSGTYDVDVDWVGSETATEECPETGLSTTVTVDNDAPRFDHVAASFPTFYPRRDDAFGAYRDVQTVTGVRVNELSTAWAQVFRHGSSTPLLTRALGRHFADTDVAFDWDGRHSDGSLYPAGTYDVRFRVRDFVGNTRYTPRTSFSLSHRHVVAHAVTDLKPAASYGWVERTSGCDLHLSNPDSRYARGLRLTSSGGCTYNPDATERAVVNWTLSVPRALRYASFTPFVYGGTRTKPAKLLFATHDFTRAAGDVVDVGEGGKATRRYTFQSVSGPAFVSPVHRFRLSAVLQGEHNLDYDLCNVGVTIRYGVLSG
jgi:hypothetical protein